LKTAIALLFSLCLSLKAGETTDLAGRWDFQLDPLDQGLASNFAAKPFADSIRLPGTTSQAGKGIPLVLQPQLPKPTPENLNPKRGLTFGRDNSVLTNSPLAHLYPRFSYVGPAWYRRTVEIPGSWTNRDVRLVLERVLWESRLWVNGRACGSQNSLTTPHRYDVTLALKPGRNEILIRVDNRRQLAIGNPHAYTDESQTIWNGIIGRLALEARDPIRIDHLELRPEPERQGVEVTVQTHNGSGRIVAAGLCLQAAPANFTGNPLPVVKSAISLSPGDGEQKWLYPMGTNFEWWSEFNPRLYRLQASLAYEHIHNVQSEMWSLGQVGAAPGPPSLAGKSIRSELSGMFGMREFKADGRGFTVNGQPVFLRGTVNCCEFPATGFPDMTGDQWRKIFSTVKACGLNHVRFHTWCPPEAAFDLADRYGIYLEVELPDWSFKLGQDAAVTGFFRTEGERMIHEYGNHPSWVMFTLGNELKGDYAVLDELVSHFRQLEPQMLYAGTTYPSSRRGKVPEPGDDYFISQDTNAGRVRGQDILNNTPPNTETNFAAAASGLDVPLVSHEVGQYCVYPALAGIPKYDGVLRAAGFEAIRDDLKQKGRLAEAGIYTRDSGKLAVLLYQEEIERALRTPNQAGLQLLQLNDFPGQGTSTVGLWDAFWDGKNLITPEEFQRFCAPVVPLMLMAKRVYQNDEKFEAGLEVANFGPAPLKDQTVAWKLFDGKKEIGTGSVKAPFIPLGHGSELGRVRQPLSTVTHAAKLQLTCELPGTTIRNGWSIWVYPANTSLVANDVAIFQAATEAFYQALRDGKRVLLLPASADLASPLAAQFTPVFWNPVMFPNQPGSMGAMIGARHPVFAEFPTDPWTNWQWWELLHDSFAINLEAVRGKITMPVRFVDRFDRNALPAALFEARVGAGRLLVCTLDLSSQLEARIAARQLRRSIIDYMNGSRFQPRERLNPAELENMFKPEARGSKSESQVRRRL